MKLLFFTIIFLFSTSLFASQLPYKGPLMSKSESPGFTPEAHAKFKVCNIYTDRIELEKGVGSISVKEVKPISLSGDVYGLIEKASKAKQSTSHGPTDGPGASYSVAVTEGTLTKLKALFQKGIINKTTEGQSALHLKNLMDYLCE